jgi:hypothetical protein
MYSYIEKVSENFHQTVYCLPPLVEREEKQAATLFETVTLNKIYAEGTGKGNVQIKYISSANNLHAKHKQITSFHQTDGFTL